MCGVRISQSVDVVNIDNVFFQMLNVQQVFKIMFDAVKNNFYF